MFGEDLFDKIMEETNCYARQNLADSEQRLGSTERHNQSQSESLLWNVRYRGDEYTSQSCRPLEARHVYGQ